ncbi:hypothetical protein ACFLTI_04540 [Bacteroidota bacterium]
MSEGYELIIEKLDNFIRKYYKDQLFKGAIISLIVALAMIMIVSIIGFFGQFESNIRTLLFYIMIAISSVVLIFFCIIPIIKLVRIGRRISYEKASKLISSHFIDIEDKLINVLELKEKITNNTIDRELIIASIEQKTDKIRIFNYNLAIDLKKNLRRLFYFLCFFAASVLIVSFFPAIVTKGTSQILFYEKEFNIKIPFSINVLNDSLFVKKGEDFIINAEIKGIKEEDEAYIVFGGKEFLLKNTGDNNYSYKFSNLNNNIKLYFKTGNNQSDLYEISVLAGPVIINYDIIVSPPEYTNEKVIEYNNIGEIAVQIGSLVKWEFNTRNVKLFEFINENNITLLKNTEGDLFVTDTVLLNDYIYEIAVSNEYFNRENNVFFKIEVIPDLYPDIYIECINDSVFETVKYFRGIIEDDYGFTNLEFISFNSENEELLNKVPIQIYNNQLKQEIYYSFDVKKSGIKKIGYYFEVTDNDEVNGVKTSRSKTFYYEIPDEKEIFQKSDESYLNSGNKIDESKKLTEEIIDEINKVRETNINKEGSQWEVEQLIKNINNNSKRLEEIVNEITNENKNKNDYLSDFTELDNEIINKQKEIEKLLEKIVDEELKDLLKELEELQNNNNNDRFRDVYKELEVSYKELAEQLDKNLELLKRLEIEEKLNQIENSLDKLAKEQENLGNEYENNEKNQDNVTDEQNKINQKFDDIKNELNKAEELNEKIKEPFEIDKINEDKEKIDQNFDDIKESLEKKRKKKTNEKMADNARELKDMAKKLKLLRNEANKKTVVEDLNNLRNILENLIEFSFGQEDNIYDMREKIKEDPKIVEVVNKQRKLEEEFVSIKDSLNMIGRRTPFFGSQISDELKKIELGFTKINKAIEINNIVVNTQAVLKLNVEQQFVMTYANNLALLLSEMIKFLQSQSGFGDGGEDCEGEESSGGSGQKSSMMESLKEGQAGLKEQIKQMIKDLKNGNGENGGQMTERLGKMLAKQEIMKQLLQNILENGDIGNDAKQFLNEVKNFMDEVEDDIINKNINPLTVLRQENVITRLLQAEKAEREREIEEKRESRESKNEIFSNPYESLEYKEISKEYTDLLKKEGIRFKSYYKKRFREYILKIKEEEKNEE